MVRGWLQKFEGEFLLFSILVHVALFLCLWISPRRQSHKVEIVEITFAQPRAKPPPPPPAPMPEPIKQIVEQDKGANSPEPTKTQFLSEHNQVVKVQTQAEAKGQFHNRRARGRKTEQISEEKNDQKTVGAEKKLEPLPDLSKSFQAAAKSGDEGDSDGEKMKTSDYLKDVQKGLKTMLNTRQFAYYKYYNLIKSKIGASWEPTIRSRAAIEEQEGRSMASDEQTTELLVTLDRIGNLINVEVLKSSGVPNFDRAAMEAFRTSAPFPEPPKGMLNSKGEIRIHYDFIIQH